MVYPDNLIEFPNRPRLTVARYFEAALQVGRGVLQLPFVPFDGGPHISERLQLEMPANKAKIGFQYVKIAKQLKRQKRVELEQLELEREELEMIEDPEALEAAEAAAQTIAEEITGFSAMKVNGYDLMTHAVLDIREQPRTPIAIIEETVAYARDQETKPQLLIPPGRVSEDEATVATNFLEVYRTDR